MVRRLLFASCLVSAFLSAQQPPAPRKTPPPAQKEQEPPEEDESLKPKEYTLNPLEAEKNITAGNFYFKKGKFQAAVRRFDEATKWDPGSAEAFLRLGEADEKVHDASGARQAFTKYLELSPEAKNAAEIRKKLSKLPK